MPEISARFCNHFGESRRWQIWDVARDPNDPKEVFNDYLGPDECAGPLILYSADGQYGHARWGRSDGSVEEDDVVDGARVEMY